MKFLSRKGKHNPNSGVFIFRQGKKTETKPRVFALTDMGNLKGGTGVSPVKSGGGMRGPQID